MVIEILTKVRIIHAQSEYFNKEKRRTKHITRMKNTKLKNSTGSSKETRQMKQEERVNSKIEHEINQIREEKKKE